MTDITVFRERNIPGKRVNWDERRSLIIKHFPATDEQNWPELTGADSSFERVLQDILKYDQREQGRDGPRPNLDWEKGIRSWRQITGQDYTGLPFPQAFRAVARDRSGRPHSMTTIARNTGISRSRVHRLINGQEEPDLQSIALVASAYGKKPSFFAEYRAEIIARRLIAILADNPEYSVSVYRKVVNS
jgi:DNA-binding phage protein